MNPLNGYNQRQATYLPDFSVGAVGSSLLASRILVNPEKSKGRFATRQEVFPKK